MTAATKQRSFKRNLIIGLVVIDLLLLMVFFGFSHEVVITYQVSNINGAPSATIEYASPNPAATTPASITSDLPWQTSFTLKRTLFQRYFRSDYLPRLRVTAEAPTSTTVPNVELECAIIVGDDVLLRNRAENHVSCVLD